MIKGFQFKKSKYPIFKISFWILILCSILMIACIIMKNFYVFNIKNIGSTIKPITVNVAFNTKIKSPVFLCFDDYCKPIQNNSLIDNALNLTNSYSVDFNNTDEEFIKKSIKKIYLAYPAKLKHFPYTLDSVNFYIGDEYRYFSQEDIKNLKTKNTYILLEGQEEKVEYTLFEFENTNNNYGIFHCIGVILLSFIFNWNFYIVPYIWLFVAVLIFLFNKDAFKDTLKRKAAIIGVLILVYIFIFGLAYFAVPKLKNGKNDLIDFALKDGKNYTDYEIHILSNEEKPKQIDNENIFWHFVDVEKDGKINKIEREKYLSKNKRGIIYFDSNVGAEQMMMIGNKRLQLFKTNYGQNAKIIYYKEQ